MMPQNQPYGLDTDEKRIPMPMEMFVRASHGSLEHALEQIARQNLESLAAGYVAPYRVVGDGTVLVTISYMEVMRRRFERGQGS